MRVSRQNRCFRRAWALVLPLAVSFAGCTHPMEWLRNGLKVGPNFAPRAAAVAPHWIDAADVRVQSNEPPPEQWWTILNDPILNSLIQQAVNQNLTLRAAGIRILEARYQQAIVIGTIFPQTQDAFASYTRTRVSESQGDVHPNPFGTWRMGFELAWELDFWGRFRRAIEAATDDLDASVFDYDGALVTLLADVASNYIQYRTLERRIALAKANAEIFKGTLDVAKNRVAAGRTSELDVDQATANLRQIESAIPGLQILQRQAGNRLCLLLGIPPHDLSDELKSAPLPTAPEDAIVGIPADLLRRRPDVLRAEAQMAAQCARIGVAVSELYPHISLSGNIGLQAPQFSRLFNSNATFYQYGPSVQWNILNYGRLANNVLLQDAKFGELYVNYQNTVLQANTEVENGLVTFLLSHQRVRDLKDAVDAAQKGVVRVGALYEAGRIDYGRVFQLQQFQVQEQDLLAQAEGDLLLGLIDIYRAVGGGWQVHEQAHQLNIPETPPTPVQP